jgi:ribosomal protein L28
MARDYVTGKKSQFGKSHTHHRGVAGGRWKKRAQKTLRIFKPNLQNVTIIEDGKKKKVTIAAKTLKRIKKDIVEGKKAAVKLAYIPTNVKQAVEKRKQAQKTPEK